MDTRIEKFTKAFFWTGYAVFLSASIPHIAAYFRHFDPVTPYRWEDVSYWVIATAIAIVIDVSDVLVSIAVMRAKASGAKFGDVAGYWVFIVFITALSWLINWQYNVVFGTSQFHTVDQYNLLGKVTIGQINPVLGSAFQMLLLVYTAMAHKFAQKPKTVDELQSELSRLQALESVQNQLNDYHERNRKPSLIQRTKETAKEIKAAAKEVLSEEAQDTSQTNVAAATDKPKSSTQEEISEEVHRAPQTVVLESIEVEVETEVLEQDPALENGSDEEVNTDPGMEVANVVPFHQHGNKDFPKPTTKEKIARKRLFTIAQAAEELKCTPRHVRDLRKKGTLAADQNGLIVGASLRSYIANRKARIS